MIDHVIIAGHAVPVRRQAGWAFSPYDTIIANYGHCGSMVGQLVISRHPGKDEVVFVWDSTRPATPVTHTVHQFEDMPHVVAILEERRGK